MKKLLTYLLAFIVSSSACAQFPYKLSVLNEPYVPLSGATSINHGIVWTVNNWWAAPIGFNFQIDTININSIGLQGPANIITDTNSDDVITSGFIPTDATLLDRGWGTSTSLSPLRYTITGTPGSRIFKYEAYNAGFEGEYDSLHTLNDSVDMQVWLYEGSNIVELRYGPSKVTHPEYEFTLTVPGETAVTYFKDIDYGTGNFFVLNGDPTNPSVTDFYIYDDTAVIPTPFKALSSFPANGTVYRFTPITSAVANVTPLGGIKIFPNPVKDRLEIQHLSSGTSVRICDITGKIFVEAETEKDGNIVLNTNNLLPGIYILECNNANLNQKEVRKLIKE